MNFVWGVLAVLALVSANGFFVAAEFALVKVRKTRIDQLVAEGRRSAKIVQGQLAHLDNYIAATQLGITLASLALGWVGEPALARGFDHVFLQLLGEESHVLSHALAFGVSFFLITGLHIVMGELVPKSIALQRSEVTAMWVARPLNIFNRIFRPIVLLMNGIGNMVVRSFGLASTDEHAAIHSVEELEMLVAQSREAGILKPSEEQMLRRVFDFGDKRVSQVMMPRTEIEGISSNTHFSQVIELAATHRFTRFPVYEDSLDNIIGVLNIKDLFETVYQTQQGRTPTFNLRSLIRPVISVPGVLSIDELLSKMQAEQTHMAVVIDEYGGTAGIVTFEDILEELVGDVRDEFDTIDEDSRRPVEVRDDGSSEISGMMTVSDFNDQFGTELNEQEGYDTIAGFVLMQLRRSAEVGDEVSVGHYSLHVDEMDDFRIARLIVRQSDAESSEEPAAEPAE
jgi:putative hemolysin